MSVQTFGSASSLMSNPSDTLFCQSFISSLPPAISSSVSTASERLIQRASEFDSTCRICIDPYSSSKKPLVFRCGHGTCEDCFNKMKTLVGRVKCLNCRKPINESVVNYDLLERLPQDAPANPPVNKNQEEKSTERKRPDPVVQSQSSLVAAESNLLDAAETGDLNRVRVLISQWPEDREAGARSGTYSLDDFETALTRAAGNGHREIVVALFAAGWTDNRAHLGVALVQALFSGQADIAAFLLANGVNPAYASPLLSASAATLLSRLIAEGAQTNRALLTPSPIHDSFIRRTELALSRGWNLSPHEITTLDYLRNNLRSNSVNNAPVLNNPSPDLSHLNRGNSASNSRNEEKKEREEKRPAADRVVQSSSYVLDEGVNARSNLSEAAQAGDLSQVRSMISQWPKNPESGALLGTFLVPVFNDALRRAVRNGHFQIVVDLFAAGWTDQSGVLETALSIALEQGHMTIASFLLSNGVSIELASLSDSATQLMNRLIAQGAQTDRALLTPSRIHDSFIRDIGRRLERGDYIESREMTRYNYLRSNLWSYKRNNTPVLNTPSRTSSHLNRRNSASDSRNEEKKDREEKRPAAVGQSRTSPEAAERLEAAQAQPIPAQRDHFQGGLWQRASNLGSSLIGGVTSLARNAFGMLSSVVAPLGRVRQPQNAGQGNLRGEGAQAHRGPAGANPLRIGSSASTSSSARSAITQSRNLNSHS